MKINREKGGEGEEGMRKYFAKWSPCRIRKVHMKLIGKNEIYRPGSELAGIDGTRDMYHFAGRNVPKHDAATTTEGLKEVAKLVLKRDGGRRLSREEKRLLAELDKEKIAVMKDREGGQILHQRSRFQEKRKLPTEKSRDGTPSGPGWRLVFAPHVRSQITRSATSPGRTRLSFLLFRMVK